MALSTSNYRIKVDNTYSTAANATSVASSINTTLAGLGRPETAVANSTNVYLMIVGLTESEAVTIRDSIKAGWSGQARTLGKVSVTRTNDLD